MTYVGIDPSLTSPGLAILNEDLSVRGLFNLATKKLRGGERLAAIYDWACSHLKDLGPAKAAIEGYALKAQNRPFDLGEAGGVLRLALTKNWIPYQVVTPAEVKKFATGNGQATKEQIRRCIHARWGLDIPQEDQADAYVIGRFSVKPAPPTIKLPRTYYRL